MEDAELFSRGWSGVDVRVGEVKEVHKVSQKQQN